MNTGITTDEFALLREYIREHCGIALGEEKAYLVETRLASLMAKNGCSNFGEFYRLAASNATVGLREKIIDAITTNETLWFRDSHPFSILSDVLLPEATKDLISGTKEKVRIWSAASSTGQEPYSIAITIQEYCDVNRNVKPEQFEIMATDISSSALFLAKAARYDSIAVNRGLSAERCNRYFDQEDTIWKLKDSVKSLVTFEKFNLQDTPEKLGRFDIVFLRYVAIYFCVDFKKKIFERIARISSPTGFLILGAVESLRGISEEYNAHMHGGGYYYVRKQRRGFYR